MFFQFLYVWNMKKKRERKYMAAPRYGEEGSLIYIERVNIGTGRDSARVQSGHSQTELGHVGRWEGEVQGESRVSQEAKGTKGAGNQNVWTI